MLIVSNYHYIRENFNQKYKSIFGLTPSQLKSQLLKLSEIGKFVSQGDLLKSVKDKKKLEGINFLITFDDGLKEQYEIAYPILKKLGIPFIIFINPINFLEKKVSYVHKIHLIRSVISNDEFEKYIKNLEIYPKDKIYSEVEKVTIKSQYQFDDFETAVFKYFLNFKLSLLKESNIINELFDNFFEEQKIFEELYLDKFMIKELSQFGFIASHTYSHLPLGLLTASEIEEELSKSKRALENLTDTEIYSVSFPYGNEISYQHPVLNLSEKAGYRLGFTMANRFNEDDFYLNPLTISRFDCNNIPGGKNCKTSEFLDNLKKLN